MRVMWKRKWFLLRKELKKGFKGLTLWNSPSMVSHNHSFVLSSGFTSSISLDTYQFSSHILFCFSTYIKFWDKTHDHLYTTLK